MSDARVGYALMHAPVRGRRALMVDKIKRSFPLLAVEVDYEMSGCLPTHRRAWRKLVDAAGSDYDWLHVTCEDVLPCRDFLAAHAHVLGLAPDDAACVSLMTGRGNFKTLAEKHDSAWIRCRGALFGSMISMRASAAADYLDWIDRWIPADERRLGDDSAQLLFMHFNDLEAYVPVPMLVDHDTTDSVMGHNSPAIRGRNAADPLGDRDWRDYDWERGRDSAPKAPIGEGPVTKGWRMAIEELSAPHGRVVNEEER